MTVNAAHRKVWILAGEASGDTYGAALAQALLAQQPDLTIQAMGGPALRAAGVDIIVDSTELGVVGLVEVLKHYPMFRRIFWSLVARAEAERPDVVVLIDYPGFNLRFAKQLHKRGIKVVYYVSPQVWAWGKRRIPLMARILHKMLVIFPFETAIWEQAGLPVRFVGHPLIPILRERVADGASRDDHTVLLLPGSRFSELDRLLPPIYATACRLHADHPELRFVLATPREKIRDRVQQALAALRGQHADPVDVQVVCGETETWMRRATAGIAASGTVTVQAAILGLPLVVCYRMNPITAAIARMLVDVPYITMVNLVAKREVYEEYLQADVSPAVLAPALERILPHGPRRADVLRGIDDAVLALGGDTDASTQAATEVLAAITEPARG